MQLDRLIAALGPTEVANAASPEIADLAYDTRAVTPGTLFFCVPGATRDGHELAPEAVRAGAAAPVVDPPAPAAPPPPPPPHPPPPPPPPPPPLLRRPPP